MSAAVLPTSNVAANIGARPLPITVSGYRVDRTAALFDGKVGIEGCDATFREDAIGDMNTHVFSGPVRD